MKVSASSGKTFDLIPAGNHTGRCFQVIELGKQPSGNPAFDPKQKVMIGWELPGILIDIDGEKKPRIISQEYTANIGTMANLGRDLVAWRGRDFTKEEAKSFNLDTILGVPCSINVIHKETNTGTYANIKGLSPLNVDLKCPPAILDVIKYDLVDGEPPETIPQWIRDKIAKRLPDDEEKPVEEAKPAFDTSEDTDEPPF
mgnify:CR=1 FL=1|tara:strand:+ start:2620 stop:3219 length:600 start_codon:yes stop_codon:yes gene_type:complete